MDIGLYTDSLTDHPFEEALDIAAGCGVRSIEIATGGQSSAPPLDVDALLASAAARAAFLAAFASRGLRIAALNCSAWPMHPVLGEAGDPGAPAAELLRALGVTPPAEGSRQASEQTKLDLAAIRAAFEEGYSVSG